ncbi:MAG: glycoside hydrolase N-terminal domain-containing protein [Mediterraneibacter faecis]
MNKTLKYISPAKSFTEALPLGNGSLGAMVYGSCSGGKNHFKL